MVTNIFKDYPKSILNFNSKSTFRITYEYNSNIDEDTPIYRYFEIEHLLKLLKNKKNILVKPEKWDDTWENILLQQTPKTKDGRQVYLHELRKEYYAQCWTLNEEESDALWRIYSPQKSRVRIKTTIGKLFKSLYNQTSVKVDDQFFIGQVIYETKGNIIKYLSDNINSIFLCENEFVNIAKTLLLKRKEFIHENEVRIIYRGLKDFDDLENPVFDYDIDPNYLIEEVLFDPRFDKMVFDVMKNHIQKKLKFKDEVKMSDLYELPELNLVIDYPK